MTYRDKLIAWNSTPKYKKELDFLYKLIDPKRGQKILDYGCGIGTAMKHIHFISECKVFGFDITKDLYMWDDFWFRNEMYFKVDTIYFNHSIAHIQYPPLKKIKDEFLNEGGKVIVVTPNWEWMDKGYNNDPTVVKHYDIDTLSQLFIDAGYAIDQIGQFGEVRKDIHQHNRLSNERIFLVAK